MKASKGKVLVLVDEAKEMDDGIFIPKNVRKVPQTATIISVSPTAPEYLKEGGRVWIPEGSGIPIEYEDTIYTVLEESYIYLYE